MNLKLKSLVVAIALGSLVTTATASSVITNITASGPGLGSFSFEDPSPTFKYLSTAFSSVDPITLTFTVAHTEGANLEHNIYETLGNGTATAFTDFHLHIDAPVGNQGNDVAFNYFNLNDHYLAPDFAPSFTLDSPSNSQPTPFEPTGPRDLNFTGELKAGASAEDGYFNLNIPDPGAGNTYTFSLVQTPSVGVVPEPETYAMFLAGLGLMGFMAKRRKQIT
jgi:hypothetical protein